MKILQKILLGAMMTLLLFSAVPQTFAANTLLPDVDPETWSYECDPSNPDEWVFWESFFQDQDIMEYYIAELDSDQARGILGCALKTGNIQFWMVKYFIVYMLQFILSLASLIAILMIIVGAYYYIAGGLTDDKEKGKTIIKYAIGGLILTTVSWVLVNVLLLALSS